MRANISRKSAMTLTEIMMAITILAVAFLPIIGVMGSSVRLTEKDDRMINAISIGQEKLNKALQFPFGKLEPGPLGSVTLGGDNVVEFTAGTPGNPIELVLGPEEINGMTFTTTLTITDLPGVFQVPTYDPLLRGQDLDRAEETGADPNPDNWGWNTSNFNYNGMLYQYVLTVVWRDKGETRDKFYSLASFKANIRR